MAILALCIIFLFIPQTAHAYIDPGTGGLVASFFSTIVIVAISVGSFILAFIIKPFWRFLKKVAKSIWKNKIFRFSFFLLLCLAVAIPVFSYYKKENNMQNIIGNSHKKVIVLGIDGFDPNIADFLMQQNKLPNFTKLRDTGYYSKLQTITPVMSPVIWTSIATGQNPGKTNIMEFMRFDREKMLPFLTIIDESRTITGVKYSSPIKGTPIWDSTSNADVWTSIIHWPVTFPASKINGESLSGMGVTDVRGFMNGYLRYTNKNINEAEMGADRVVKVEPISGQIEAEIQGPAKTTNNGYVAESFSVKINKDGNSATFTIQDTDYEIKKQEWSGWIKVKFKQGFGKNTNAILKIYAENFTPEFDMFVTSVQFDPALPAMPISYPEDFSKTLDADIGKFYTLGMPEDTKAVNDRNLSTEALIAQVDEIGYEREKMLWRELDILNKKDSGLMMIVFDEFDRLNHILYSEEVVVENNQIKSVGPNIEKIYIEKDRMIGELLEKINNDTALMIMSDHGFKHFTKAVNLNKWLYDNGYLVLKNGVKPKDAASLYKDVDWTKTRAYSYGYISINLNIEGREKNGIVSEANKINLIKEIRNKLSDFSDGENKVIKNTYLKSDIYSGTYIDNAADILVGFDVPYRSDWESPIGDFADDAVADNTRPWHADHMYDAGLVSGVLFTNFKVSKATPSVYDIAPTIEKILNIKSNTDFDGNTLIQ